MRTIKFRAWWQHPEYEPKGKMYLVGGLMFATPQEGEPEYDDCNTPKMVGLMERENNDKIGWNDAKECKLMQYTGCLDENGKEIYEGDILSFYNASLPKGTKDMYKKHVVKWDNRQAKWDIFFVGEIIGNIYENPELLTNK